MVQQSQDQDSVVQGVHQTENGQSEDIFKKLDEISNKMLKLAYEFKRTVDEAKEINRQQRREQALVAQLGGRGDVIETVGLQPASDTHNKKVTLSVFVLLCIAYNISFACIYVNLFIYFFSLFLNKNFLFLVCQLQSRSIC